MKNVSSSRKIEIIFDNIRFVSAENKNHKRCSLFLQENHHVNRVNRRKKEQKKPVMSYDLETQNLMQIFLGFRFKL